MLKKMDTFSHTNLTLQKGSKFLRCSYWPLRQQFSAGTNQCGQVHQEQHSKLWGGRPWHLPLHRSWGQARKWLGSWPSVGWLRSVQTSSSRGGTRGCCSSSEWHKKSGKSRSSNSLTCLLPCQLDCGEQRFITLPCTWASHSSFSRVQG